MKRYVKEYASELLKNATEADEYRINNILWYCEHGHITEPEAMRCLSLDGQVTANVKLNVLNSIGKHLSLFNCELGASQSDMVRNALYGAINNAIEDVLGEE